jgi:hypothetical protein
VRDLREERMARFRQSQINKNRIKEISENQTGEIISN